MPANAHDVLAVEDYVDHALGVQPVTRRVDPDIDIGFAGGGMDVFGTPIVDSMSDAERG